MPTSPRLVALFLAACWLGLSAAPAAAAWQPKRWRAAAQRPAPAATPTPRPAVATERVSMTLDNLMSYPGPLRLERVRSEATVAVPVSLRMAVHRARLRLHVSNSASLIKRRSHLAVVMNDRVITQIPLDGGKPTGTYDIALPPDVFKADFNRLTFRVAQHYVLEECEDPFAPELWTEVDTHRSSVELDIAYRPIQPRLADLGEIFSAKDPAPRQVAMMAASTSLLDEAALRTGALLSQGVALRLRFVPLTVQAATPRVRASEAGVAPLSGLDPASFKARDGVLFGTAEQVAPFVGAGVAERIKGPFLGVYPLPSDPTRIVLVASGRDEAEVRTAATAFSFLDSPYPDSAEAVVRGLNQPNWPDYAGRNVLATGRKYSFRELGMQSVTLNGLNKEEVEVKFNLPADVWVLEDDKLPLRLHFSHGAGLQTNSVINVLVNRKFGDAINVSEERSRVYNGHLMELPLRLFRPGENTITFVPRFLPKGTGPCSPLPTDGLPMTLFSDSSMTLPDLAHFTEMPNLDLFGRTGFPYTKLPDGRGTRLWVGGDDRGTVESAWTLMARLSQTTGMPLFRAEASFDPTAPKDDLIVIGPRAALPATLLEPYDRQRVDDAEGLPAFLTNQPPEARTLVRFGLGTASGDLITAAQFQSPFMEKKTVTLFTADSPRALAAGMQGFVRPASWGGLQGARTYWDPDNQRLAWQGSDESYQLGTLNPMLELGRLGSKYPLPFAGLVVGVVVVIAFALAFLLRRRFHQEHRRHGDTERLH